MITDVVRRRLYHQRLTHRKFDTVEEVVSHFGAVQAQEYRFGLWAIGLRMEGVTEAAVEAAVVERKIVRTWPQRGTLHFVAAPDIRWWLASAAQAGLQHYRSYFRRLELDDDTCQRANEALREALAGGARLTRQEMYRALDDRGFETKEMRGQFILFRAAADGVICFGPRRGKQYTFTLLDEWLPETPMMSREEAGVEIARRYFTSHGPATLQDFVWWSGFRVPEATSALEGAQPDLDCEAIEGKTYWFARESVPVDAEPSAHLLPYYDEYFVAYKERTAALDDTQRSIASRPSDLLYPTFVVDGRALGNWKRKVGKGGVEVNLAPFSHLTSDETEAYHVAVAQYGAFLGMDAVPLVVTG